MTRAQAARVQTVAFAAKCNNARKLYRPSAFGLSTTDWAHFRAHLARLLLGPFKN
jgi:hypothetical protein